MNVIITNESDTPVEIVANGKVIHTIGPNGDSVRQAGNLEITLQDAAGEVKSEGDGDGA